MVFVQTEITNFNAVYCKFLLLENVPGLLNHDSGRTFAAILSTLDELGYDVAWQVLNSADHYVAQSRKRLFIVGFLRGECAGKVLSFTEANPKTPALNCGSKISKKNLKNSSI